MPMTSERAHEVIACRHGAYAVRQNPISHMLRVTDPAGFALGPERPNYRQAVIDCAEMTVRIVLTRMENSEAQIAKRGMGRRA